MPYLGRAATNAGSVNYLDDISSGFDGSDTTFTCAISGTTITPGQENVFIYLDGVFQDPGSSKAYTISGSTITFTEAPANGTIFTGYVAGEGAYLDDGTVSTAKLDDDAVTASKLDDDGTGFQVGDLGVGGSLTSGDKLTVTGRLRASGGILGDLTGDVTGNVTGNTSGTAATVTGAAQTAITSVGTLSSLTTSGNVELTGTSGQHLKFADDSGSSWSGNHAKIQHHNSYMYLQGGSSGIILRTNSGTNALTMDSSGNSNFSKNITLNTSSHSTLLIKGADGCDAEIALQSDNADDNTDQWSINAKASTGGTLHFATYGSGAWTNPLILSHTSATFSGRINQVGDTGTGAYAATFKNTNSTRAAGVLIDTTFNNSSLDEPLLAVRMAGTSIFNVSSNGTSTFAGNIVGSGRLQIANNLDATFGVELFNAHATGHGVKIRGGDTSSHYSLYVSDHDQSKLNFQVLGDGKCQTGSELTVGMNATGFAAVRGSASVQITNGGSINVATGDNHFIMLSENTLGRGALFHCTYPQATPNKMSDPSSIFSASDTSNKVCVFSSANSSTTTIKNNMGSTLNFRIIVFGV